MTGASGRDIRLTLRGHSLPTTWLTMGPSPPNGACSSTVRTAFELEAAFTIAALSSGLIQYISTTAALIPRSSKSSAAALCRSYHLAAGNDRQHLFLLSDHRCLIHLKWYISFFVNRVYRITSNTYISWLLILEQCFLSDLLSEDDHLGYKLSCSGLQTLLRYPVRNDGSFPAHRSLCHR